MRLLHIDSSILGKDSVSRQLTRAVVDELRRIHPAIEVDYRDLGRQAPDHFSAEALLARSVDPSQRTAAQREEAAREQELLEEFLAADIIVLGAPMYNFSIPSQLKAWLDRIIVAGRTFRYTVEGPVGLAAGKRVVIASSRGGSYPAGSPAQAMDHQETYLESALGFMGIKDIEVIRAEGIAISPQNREQAIAAALSQVSESFKAVA